MPSYATKFVVYKLVPNKGFVMYLFTNLIVDNIDWKLSKTNNLKDQYAVVRIESWIN